MIRKIFSYAILALTMSSACLAQDAEEKTHQNTWHIKLYGLTTVEEKANNSPIFSSTTTRLSSDRLLNPTIAVGKRTAKGNQHEIELTSAAINSYKNQTVIYGFGGEKIYVAGSEVFETYFAARYEYILNFIKRQNTKLVPSVGFSASPYYLRYNLVPYTTAAFPAKETTIGARLFIAPRLNYNISKRLFLDLNIPICLAEVNYKTHKEQNPTVATQNQSFSSINADVLPKYISARLGIGLRL